MSAPGWVRALLARAVPPDRRDDVLGDLEEVHGRRRGRLGGFAAWGLTSGDGLLVAAAFLLSRARAAASPGRWVTASEVRLSLRWVLRQPVMAATAALALAIGIGLATTGFSVLEATLFGELPLPDGDRFVRLRAYAEPGGRTEVDLDRYRRLLGDRVSFEQVGAIAGGTFNLRLPEGAVVPVRGALVTPRSFDHVPAVPLLGRNLRPADAEPGAVAAAVVRASLWSRQFGSDPGIVGRTLDVAGTVRTVVGVLPDEVRFPAAGEIWLPLDDATLGGSPAGPRPGVDVVAVLRPGETIASAQARVTGLVDPAAAGAAAGPEVRVRVVPYTEPPEGWELMMTTLVIVLVLVLLLVAANVANLVAARIASRVAELAVRTALGAPRARLIGQLSVEVAALGVVAAAFGLALARSGLAWLDLQLGDEMPFWIELAPGPRTFAFVAGATLLATLVAGVVPAVRATRRDPAGRLRAATAGGGGVGRLGVAMVVGEMALSVALLSGALVMARGFVNHLGGDLPLPEGEVLTARIVEPDGPEGAPSRRGALLRAAEALPGVRAAGAASHLPRIDPPTRATELAAEAGEAAAEAVRVPVAGVDAGYFAALGAGAIRGRLLRDEDFLDGAPPVAVVNQPFVDRHLGGRNPLGRRLRDVEPGEDGGAPAGPWREIVGVVPDLGLSVADPALAAGYYVPLGRDEPVYYLALRTTGDPLTQVEALREAVAGVDPEVLAANVVPLERVGLDERAFMSGFGTALSAMGGMALLLSLAGIYAMLSFTVTRRRREIGVRLALGATAPRIVRAIVGRCALHLAAGAGLGGALAVLLSRGKSLFVTRFPTGEPWLLPAVIAVLFVAGVVASWLPVRRALAVEATEALRAD